MILNVSEALRNPGQEYRFSGEQAIAAIDVYGEHISFDDAHVEGTFFTADDGSVAVDGSITTVCYGRCANCLSPANQEIKTFFQETFIRNGDPEDDEIFSYQGYKVSLEKLVMSYAVLEVPIRFLCKKDCKGYMGTDEESSHDDDNQQNANVQHPFACLSQLLDSKEE